MAQPLAITPGEPAGVGPELVIALAQQARPLPWVVVADADLLRERARALGVALRVDDHLDDPAGGPGELSVAHVPLATPSRPGSLDPANASYVQATLEEATRGCLTGRYSGLVTGPVQKSVMNDAGMAFSGHTEWLRDRSGVDDVVMLLVTDQLRVAMATTHMPLSQVAGSITSELLARRLGILLAGLRALFAIERPRVLVCGLNPHAGEGGYLGGEEIAVIEPVCEDFRVAGEDVVGPLSADTLFTPRYLTGAHAVLAMYHDQGLPVLKYAGFGRAVNVTLGLPFVRTSVDHGTALDLAGTGRADTGSLEQAVDLAARLG